MTRPKPVGHIAGIAVFIDETLPPNVAEIRPAPPTPHNPQMKPISVDRLVAREMERKGL